MNGVDEPLIHISLQFVSLMQNQCRTMALTASIRSTTRLRSTRAKGVPSTTARQMAAVMAVESDFYGWVIFLTERCGQANFFFIIRKFVGKAASKDLGDVSWRGFRS